QRLFATWERFKSTIPGLTDEQHEAIKPRRPRVFCGSLCDVFDNAVPRQWRFDLFRLISETPHLDWLLLTKRIGNAPSMIDAAIRTIKDSAPGPWGNWRNVWLGITVCNQEEYDRDITKLAAIPAARRFLSIEPMLGPINLRLYESEGLPTDDEPFRERHHLIHQIIVGGKTGAKARPMHPDWVRSIRDQCQEAGVAFFFKAWGEWGFEPYPRIGMKPYESVTIDGEQLFKCGKKRAGRLLDGCEWNEVPE
ncbi:MAG: phage Gp37/Gp68 family protein, partial [Azoarcus sp.]|nr:phage Gp37/Gp68 family protein [Azoarcus sp.]